MIPSSRPSKYIVPAHERVEIGQLSNPTPPPPPLIEIDNVNHVTLRMEPLFEVNGPGPSRTLLTRIGQGLRSFWSRKPMPRPSRAREGCGDWLCFDAILSQDIVDSGHSWGTSGRNFPCLPRQTVFSAAFPITRGCAGLHYCESSPRQNERVLVSRDGLGATVPTAYCRERSLRQFELLTQATVDRKGIRRFIARGCWLSPRRAPAFRRPWGFCVLMMLSFFRFFRFVREGLSCTLEHSIHATWLMVNLVRS